MVASPYYGGMALSSKRHNKEVVRSEFGYSPNHQINSKPIFLSNMGFSKQEKTTSKVKIPLTLCIAI